MASKSVIDSKKLQPIPKDTKAQNLLADEMKIWAERPHVLNINEFPLSKNMSPRKFFRLEHENDYFADNLNIAKETIAIRLFLMLRINEDKEFARTLLNFHSKDFREFNLEKHAKISAAIAQTNNAGTFLFQEIPNSDLVPLRRQLNDREARK